MRILELSLRNYRVFEELDLELPARVIGIFGPNGSGKSTLLESIQYALYGRARTQKDHIRTQGVLADCAVRLVFEHGGQQYEIRRTVRGRNHQTEAELYQGDLQLAAGVSEVDQEVQRLLRMDHQVFRASVFAEQKQLDAFSDVTRAKRKEMVLRLLGIRPVDEARTAARKAARDAKVQAERLAGALPDLSEQERVEAEAAARAREAEREATEAGGALEEARVRAAEARAAFEASDRARQRAEKLAVERAGAEERAADAEGRHRALAERITDLERALRHLPDLEAERAALEGARDRLDDGRRAVRAAQEVGHVAAELEALPPEDTDAVLAELAAASDDRDAARDRAGAARAAAERARADLAAAREVLARAADADPAQPCPTCGRPLGDDFREYVAHCERAVPDADQRAGEADAALREARRSLETAEDRLREAAAAAETARRAAGTRERLQERLADARARLDEVAAPFEGATPDLQVLEEDARREELLDRRLAELRAERQRLADAVRDRDAAGAELGRALRRLEELDREAAALAFDAEDHARLYKEHREADVLLDQARDAERAASDALRDARARVRELRAEIRRVREIAARARELRDAARLYDRVSVLLEGFRTFLYGRIIPQLSREAEALFRDLTNREYDDLRIDEETLAIQIADDGRYFPIERFSGSEADLANLALRVAISTHLSRMSGADVGILVLDEVLASLDVERKDLFVGTMGRLAQRFHQLFVITHAEQVKDQFPASIEVRKVGRRRSAALLS